MGAGAAVAAAFVAVAVVVLAVGKLLQWRARRRLLATVDEVTRQHAALLAVKRAQLVIHDGYGNYHLDGWIRHANYFVDHVILREARQRRVPVEDVAEGGPRRAEVLRRFLAVLQDQEGASPKAIADAEILSGQHYETLCHNLLQEAGWVVSMTPASGDQGADLVADADGCRLVIQCKFHGRPIGNKAVQEAFGALRLHGGRHAAVVSNQGFTRAAQELARANGVLLLHHDQLHDLDPRRLPAP